MLMTGLSEMNSIDFDISKANHSYRGSELEMVRLSSTWMGMIRKSGPPEGGRETELCGGVVHRPMNTA